jgi:hypothetical protein
MCQTPILTQPSGNDPPGRGSESNPKELKPIRTDKKNATLKALAVRKKDYPQSSKNSTEVTVFKQDQRGPSCVGYAAAKLVEAYFRRYGTEDSYGELDPEFLYNVGNDNDETPDNPRTTLLDALRVARDIGAPLLEDGFIYEGKSERKGASKGYVSTNLQATRGLLESARSHRIRGVVELSPWIEEWIDWLRLEGPIAVQLNITPKAFDKPTYVDGRFRVTYDDQDRSNDSHAVLLTEYVHGATPYFRFLNSLGPDYGEAGYATIDFADATRCFFRGYGAIVRDQTLPQRP